jgi:hypothetical protein
MMAKILIACEFSGIVRDAFLKQGHDAISCDLLPTESPGPHYQGDIRDILYQKWDLVIGHPPCTRLANSGVRWLAERNLWDDLKESCAFFRLFLDHPCPKICIENPIPHKYAIEKIGKYDQLIQPWMFGHGESKAICLWLKGLPKLKPTNIVDGREQKVWRMGPSENRAKERAKFYAGIAEAMAIQWRGI